MRREIVRVIAMTFLVELDGQSALSGCHAPNAIVTGSEVPRHDTAVVM